MNNKISTWKRSVFDPLLQAVAAVLWWREQMMLTASRVEPKCLGD